MKSFCKQHWDSTKADHHQLQMPSLCLPVGMDRAGDLQYSMFYATRQRRAGNWPGKELGHLTRRWVWSSESGGREQSRSHRIACQTWERLSFACIP